MGRSRCRKIRRGARRLVRLLCCCTTGAINDQGQRNDTTGQSNVCQCPRREMGEVSARGELTTNDLTAVSSDSQTDIDDVEMVGSLAAGEESDDMTCDGDETATAANCDQDCRDTASDSDKSEAIEVAQFICEEKSEEELPVTETETVCDDDTQSANDVDGGKFEDSSHGVSSTSPSAPTDDCQSKTVALANHTLPELEYDDCSLSGSEKAEKETLYYESEKVQTDENETTSVCETGDSLVELFVANLMERGLSEEGQEVERSYTQEFSSEDKYEVTSEAEVAMEKKMKFELHELELVTSDIGPTTWLSSGACEAKKSDDDYKSSDVRSISRTDSTSEKQQLGLPEKVPKADEDEDMLEHSVTVYIANLLERVVGQIAEESTRPNILTDEHEKTPHATVSDGDDDDDEDEEEDTGVTGVTGQASGIPDSEVSQQRDQRCGIFEVKLVNGPLGLGLSLGLGHFGEVLVNNIRRFSRAASQGDLRIGDRILEINGSFVTGESLGTAQKLLSRAKGEVRILAMRGQETSSPPEPPVQETVLFRVSPTANAGVILMKLNTSQDRPLGVEIEGGSDTESPYVKIAAIAPGSVAERCGMLRVGDELVEVDEVPIVGATHSQALDIIQGVSRPVTVTVQRREDFDLEARIRPTRCTALQTMLYSR